MSELIRITTDIDKALVGKTIAFSMIVFSDFGSGIVQRFTDHTFIYGKVVRPQEGQGFHYNWTADVTGDVLREIGATPEQARAFDRIRLAAEIEQATRELNSLKMRLAEVEAQ